MNLSIVALYHTPCRCSSSACSVHHVLNTRSEHHCCGFAAGCDSDARQLDDVFKEAGKSTNLSKGDIERGKERILEVFRKEVLSVLPAVASAVRAH